MNWKTQTVLVTGAGGFIGSHLVERLAALGARTRAFVRYNSAGSWGWLDESEAKDDIRVYLGDLRDPDSLKPAIQGVDVVFHLGALIAIPYSYHAPLSYVRTNVEGTLNVLQLARHENVRRFVHTSTSEVYGSARYVPIDENHPLRGQSPYAASKIGADQMAAAFHMSFGLPVSIVRPFNTYGPRQSARAVIPTIITQAMTRKDIRLGHTAPTRDFNFVSDTVEGFLRAAESHRAVGETINLGSRKEVSIRKLAEIVLRLMGKKARVARDRPRVRPRGSEVDRLCADNTKARRLLGWRPAVALESGLQKTIDWVGKNIDRYRLDTYAV